jgi:hypothetical protein
MTGLEKIGQRLPAKAGLLHRAQAPLMLLAVLALAPNIVKKWTENWGLIAPTPEAVPRSWSARSPAIRCWPICASIRCGKLSSLAWKMRCITRPCIQAVTISDRDAIATLPHLRRRRWPGITDQADFDKSFALVYQQGPVALYRIL